MCKLSSDQSYDDGILNLFQSKYYNTRWPKNRILVQYQYLLTMNIMYVRSFISETNFNNSELNCHISNFKTESSKN